MCNLPDATARLSTPALLNERTSSGNSVTTAIHNPLPDISSVIARHPLGFPVDFDDALIEAHR